MRVREGNHNNSNKQGLKRLRLALVSLKSYVNLILYLMPSGSSHLI